MGVKQSCSYFVLTYGDRVKDWTARSVVVEFIRPFRSMLKDRPMTFLRLSACLVASAGLLLACSKPGGPPAPAVASQPPNAGAPAATASAVASRNPCDLLTKADAEAAVGAELPQNSVTQTLGMCGYTSADFTNGAQLTASDWESIKKAATSGAKQPASVGGVGDEALYFTGQETGAGPLYVRHGGEGFLLVLNGSKIDHMTGADALAVEKSLALKVVARM
jgi:hypothetical protein